MICRAVGSLLAILLLVWPLTAKDPPTEQVKPPRWTMTPPTPITYPSLARFSGIEGEVRLRVRVGRDGSHRRGVSRSVVVLSGPQPLADVAREAALSWTFWRTEGKSDWFFASIRFQLKESIAAKEQQLYGELIGYNATFFNQPADVTVLASPGAFID